MKIDTSKSWVGHTATLLAIVFLASNIPLTKFILEGWVSASGYVLIRCASGAFVFWGISLFLPREIVKDKRDYLKFFVSGALILAIFFLLFSNGIGKTSPIDASIIITISPIMVLILSAFAFKERITTTKALGITLAFTGALLVILMQGGHGSSGGMIGNIYILIAAMLYGGYLVYIRPLSRTYNPIFMLKWIFLFATMVTLPLGLDDLLQSRLVTQPDNSATLTMLFIAIFPTCISYMLIPIALKSISSTMVSTYSYATPFLASIMAIFMHQAVLRWDEPISLVLIIVGVYFVSYTKKSTTSKVEPQ